MDFDYLQFSQYFHVKSPYEDWAKTLLNQKTMLLILGSARFIIQLDEHHLIAYHTELFTRQDYENAAILLINILDQIPRQDSSATQTKTA